MLARRSRICVARRLAWPCSCAVVLSWLAAVVSSQPLSDAPPEMPELTLENPAPGIYVHYGQQAEMTEANFGDVANLGFIVGGKCVAVIDTGGTFAVGRS